jgi:anti-sigma regulatory factor (Ser/Thr protein kinase)
MVPPFSAVLPDEAASLPLMRRALREWLERARWPRDEAADLILAANEAVTNAIEHAYRPGQAVTVLVTAEAVRLSGHLRCARITVSDRGRWRPAPVESNTRGRGIAMMRAIAGSLDIDSAPGGTRVTMTSRPVREERDHRLVARLMPSRVRAQKAGFERERRDQRLLSSAHPQHAGSEQGKQHRISPMVLLQGFTGRPAGRELAPDRSTDLRGEEHAQGAS